MSSGVRAGLVSSGEDIAGRFIATRLHGEQYSDGEYIAAVARAREAFLGEAYANKVLGEDGYFRRGALLSGVEQEGGEVALAAERRLRSRGIDPARAGYAEYRDALLRAVSE